jgi:hypothetical protein
MPHLDYRPPSLSATDKPSLGQRLKSLQAESLDVRMEVIVTSRTGELSTLFAEEETGNVPNEPKIQ